MRRIDSPRFFPPRGYIAALVIVACEFTCRPCAADDLLPDLFAWEDASVPSLRDGAFDTTSITGRALYRFSVAIPNIGEGPLEIREQTHADRSQDVYQRVYDSSGVVVEHFVETFPDADPAFGHLYLVGLAQYNLRQVLPNQGVGPIVSSHDKTSFGLVDGEEFDLTLPGAPSVPIYESAQDEYLGISVGWADVYRRFLPGQWVDATGLPDGEYWLEVVIDPFHRVMESDKTNNTTRVLIDLLVPGVAEGDYNGDGIVNAADYTVWRDALGHSQPGLAADGNRDGMITTADYDAWNANFGAGIGAGHVLGIPEPPTHTLVLFLCLCNSLPLPHLVWKRSSCMN